ncbi:MAG TPA: SWIM zinc finger family protein [Dehalococcoidia bacterium]|jgi:uncharacterized Zn finger protein|nr:SWIM zinc finger family protein [Dehalococcoidia bacterium]
MVSQGQIDKAKERALAQDVKVHLLEQGRRYGALSTSNDDLGYEVIIQSRHQRDITCSCPGATHRGICKHIGATLIRLETDRPEVRENLERDIEDLYYR